MANPEPECHVKQMFGVEYLVEVNGFIAYLSKKYI